MDSNSFRETLAGVGLTQAALARLTGADTVTVSRWATGRRPVPGWVVSWLMCWQAVLPAERDSLARQIGTVLHCGGELPQALASVGRARSAGRAAA